MVNNPLGPHTLLTSTLPGNVCQINEMYLQLTYTQSAVEKRDGQEKTKLLLIQNTQPIWPKTWFSRKLQMLLSPFFFFLSWREKWDKKELLRGKTNKQTNKSLFKGLQSSLSRDLNNLRRQYNTERRVKHLCVRIQVPPYLLALYPWTN